MEMTRDELSAAYVEMKKDLDSRLEGIQDPQERDNIQLRYQAETIEKNYDLIFAGIDFGENGPEIKFRDKELLMEHFGKW